MIPDNPDPGRDQPDFFVSRAGANAKFADHLAHIVEQDGHRVVVQQWDFANQNFIAMMHRALASGARVVALLSPEYLASEHCEAEWQNAIADDPLNRRERLIVLRIADCAPTGMLKALAHWDLVPVVTQPALVAGIWCQCLKQGAPTPPIAP